jgi:hypothetical protein
MIVFLHKIYIRIERTCRDSHPGRPSGAGCATLADDQGLHLCIRERLLKALNKGGVMLDVN